MKKTEYNLIYCIFSLSIYNNKFVSIYIYVFFCIYLFTYVYPSYLIFIYIFSYYSLFFLSITFSFPSLGWIFLPSCHFPLHLHFSLPHCFHAHTYTHACTYTHIFFPPPSLFLYTPLPATHTHHCIKLHHLSFIS